MSARKLEWQRFRVYYTTGGAERHTTSFATRRAAERRAEDLRARVDVKDVFVKYVD